MSAELLTKALEQHGTAVMSLGDSVDEIKSRLQELEQKSVGGVMPSTGHERGYDRLYKAIADSDSFKSMRDKQSSHAKTSIDTSLLLERKNTILGESGSPQNPDGVIAQPQRVPGVVAGAFRSLNILDLIATVPVATGMVEFPRESAWSNSAAETAEGATKPESDLSFELVQKNVRTVAHWLKVSRQAFDDSPWLASYLSERMSHGIRKRLQSQILTGNGTSPNLSGITDTGNHTAFSPVTGETALDGLNRARDAILAADYDANVCIMNPADWGAIERTKRSDSDSAFVLGDGGAASYVGGGLGPRVWGIPVVLTNDLSAGSFIMADSESMRLMLRQDATVEWFEQDDTNVTQNLITCRAEMRAAFAVFVPAAVRFGSLTA